MNKRITSAHNPLIKQLIHLREKPRERRKSNLMVIEGIREISLAVKAGYPLIALLHCPAILPPGRFRDQFPEDQLPATVVEISVDAFNRIACRKNTGGVIASARTERRTLSDVHIPPQSLVLVLESVEKPGNLGAILRTADAAGVSAIIICDQQTDLFNPNTIRSSLGTLFTNQIAIASTTETIAWLKSNGVRIIATTPSAKILYHDVDYMFPAAIILGSEASGLSDPWLAEADELIRIPMRGKVDSLNVSTSAAIVLFEVMRQRGFTSG